MGGDNLLSSSRMLERVRGELAVLRQLVQEVAYGVGLRETFSEVLKNLVDLLRAKAGYVYLVDKGYRSICLSAEYCYTAAPLPQSAEFVRLEKNSSLPIQKVIQTGNSLIIDNILYDEKLVERLTPYLGRVENSTSTVCAPLRTGGKSVGALCVWASKESMFEKEDSFLLEAVGNVLGVALVNTRLQDELRDFKGKSFSAQLDGMQTMTPENFETQDERRRTSKASLPPTCLSKREYEVFELTIKGFTCREIGQRLCLSSRTIETYRERVMEKLNLRHRHELVEYALEYKIL